MIKQVRMRFNVIPEDVEIYRLLAEYSRKKWLHFSPHHLITKGDLERITDLHKKNALLHFLNEWDEKEKPLRFESFDYSGEQMSLYDMYPDIFGEKHIL